MKMAAKYNSIKMGEMRPGLFQINWSLPYERKKNCANRPKEYFQLCGTQPGIAGRNFSITFYPKLSKKDQKVYTVVVDEIVDTVSTATRINAGVVNSTSPDDHQEQLKRIDIKVLEPEILRPVYIWIHLVEDGSNPIQLIEKNVVQWQVDCVIYLPNTIHLWMDFGINTVLENKIAVGLSVLFKNQTLCDVQFQFKDGQSVGAHMAILSAGSPAFAAVFQSGFAKSKTRKVNINKFEPQVFTHLLFFLYTGSAPKLTEINTIRSLLEVAYYYDVEALKDECINMLQKILSNDNAIEMLILSHVNLIPSPKLFEAAMKFVVKNSRQIFSQPEWMELVKNHPELCVKTNQRMAAILPPDTE